MSISGVKQAVDYDRDSLSTAPLDPKPRKIAKVSTGILGLALLVGSVALGIISGVGVIGLFAIAISSLIVAAVAGYGFMKLADKITDMLGLTPKVSISQNTDNIDEKKLESTTNVSITEELEVKDELLKWIAIASGETKTGFAYSNATILLSLFEGISDAEEKLEKEENDELRQIVIAAQSWCNYLK